ncbi:MAG: hypothetical protein V2A73_20315 [Pseudomonadota bacterium]
MAFAPVGKALAQEAVAVKKIEEINQTAMADYDILEFESAKKQLDRAFDLVKANKLHGHPVAATTHLNRGIVYGGGFGDYDRAVTEFALAQQANPKIELGGAYRTPELQRLFKEAAEKVPSLPKIEGADQTTGQTTGQTTTQTTTGQSNESTTTRTTGGEQTGRTERTGKADDGEATGGAVEEVSGLVHSPLDEAPADKPIVIAAKVGEDVRARQVVLYYRPQGKENFSPVVMKRTGGTKYEGRIPERATAADSVHYYIEAKSEDGRVNASNGSAGSPNIISVIHPVVADDDEDREEELDTENPLATRAVKKKRRAHQVFFFSVLAGTGGGLVTGRTECADPVNGGSPVSSPISDSAGFAWSPIHFMPEIGFWISREISLSAYGRLSFPAGADFPNKATFAPAAVLRLGYWLGQKQVWSIHGDVGFGVIRHVVRLTASSKEKGTVDTIASGPLLIGGGVTMSRPLAGPLRFVLEVNILAGVPIVDKLNLGGETKPNFGVNTDATLGIAFAF